MLALMILIYKAGIQCYLTLSAQARVYRSDRGGSLRPQEAEAGAWMRV